MNIDDFGIFSQNFEIYHFSKKKTQNFTFQNFKMSIFFQNHNFQNSKFASDHTETFPDAPVQSKIAYWNQPQNFSPAALALPRGSSPFFRRFLALWLVYGAPPAWGMLFERFRKNPDARIFRFSDFQFSDFQIWNPSKIQ